MTPGGDNGVGPGWWQRRQSGSAFSTVGELDPWGVGFTGSGSSLIAGFSGLCDGMGSDALGQGVNPGGAGE